MVFKQTMGNHAVKAQISSLIESGRLPHAIILEGGPDAGCLAMAREIASALVCKGNGERPCGQCPACKKMAAASHPDVFEYVAKDAPRSFPVSVIREVRNSAYVVPNEADYKIYVLGNASSMGSEAQNALLKTLEEPPASVVLILTVSSKTLLLDTVRSRSALFTLEECIRQYDEKTTDIAGQVCQALLSGNEYRLLTATAPLEGDKELFKTLMECLGASFRCALVQNASQAPENVPHAQLETLGPARLLALLQAVSQIQSDLSHNANQTLVLTRLCYLLKQAAL